MPLPQFLAEILEPAYAPCPHFAGNCKGLVKDWNPERGYVPRGFFGQPNDIADVERDGRVHIITHLTSMTVFWDDLPREFW